MSDEIELVNWCIGRPKKHLRPLVFTTENHKLQAVLSSSIAAMLQTVSDLWTQVVQWCRLELFWMNVWCGIATRRFTPTQVTRMDSNTSGLTCLGYTEMRRSTVYMECCLECRLCGNALYILSFPNASLVMQNKKSILFGCTRKELHWFDSRGGKK
jgi:hypothetical protein